MVKMSKIVNKLFQHKNFLSCSIFASSNIHWNCLTPYICFCLSISIVFYTQNQSRHSILYVNASTKLQLCLKYNSCFPFVQYVWVFNFAIRDLPIFFVVSVFDKIALTLINHLEPFVKIVLFFWIAELSKWSIIATLVFLWRFTFTKN